MGFPANSLETCQGRVGSVTKKKLTNNYIVPFKDVHLKLR